MRDRLGIKPLYWAKFDRLFLFGSELKALRAHPGWSPRIDRAAVASFMRHSYVPAPHTIYEGVHKLEPGTMLTLAHGREPQIERFWDARAVARAGLADPLRADDDELTGKLESLLTDAVRRRMVADVPLGAFLSGGIDSSTVVALMQAANAGPVRTYTIGFDIPGYDEARHAAAVARHCAPSIPSSPSPPNRRSMSSPACRISTTSRSRTLANSDFPRVGDDTPARDRGAVGRRRR